ncbi:MAG: ATP-dependent DNA ligase [Cyanobacteriota bacterium]|nr:ATP-dependent DNA ligase [Cyanobacteriota bacterium]
MQAFAELIERLDGSRGTRLKVACLVDFFDRSDPRDAAWALQVLLGGSRRRLITGRRLRQICLAGSPLPEWLFDDCYSHVGDSAETIALLWRQVAPRPDLQVGERDAVDDDPPVVDEHADVSALEPLSHRPLHHWLEQLLPAAAALGDEQQAVAVRRLWRGLNPHELLVANKLLTGGLRIGVARGLVVRALAQLSGLDEALLQHRLMGGFTPTPGAWNALLAPLDQAAGVPSRPYPFYLASPLELTGHDTGDAAPQGPTTAWLAEWKWDGIRGQLIRRQGESFLWSRGEELLNDAFPELIEAATALADGTVLDGEVIVWPPDHQQPASFALLQRRLGRKQPGRKLLGECPAAFVAYDLLELDGDDWRPRPLSQRRAALDSLIQRLPQAPQHPAAGLFRLSERLPLGDWQQLEPLRQQARVVGAEGLMLKALDSPYLSGRRRGSWWKHKLDPLRLDAVLLYAQAGSGRRANLFTDYTFGLWESAPGGDRNGSVDTVGETATDQRDAPRLVSFAKAYSGLDDGEITALDRWIRSHTTERFGPVRAVEPLQVFELAFEGVQRSSRHKSGIAVRFPRISRWRRDKPASEADTLASALALLEAGP